MTDMQPLPKDAPVMLAWADYQISDGYQNTRNWALKEDHVDGSLWAAFLAGFEACAAYEVMASRIAELEAALTYAAETTTDQHTSRKAFEALAALTQSSVQPE